MERIKKSIATVETVGSAALGVLFALGVVFAVLLEAVHPTSSPRASYGIAIACLCVCAFVFEAIYILLLSDSVLKRRFPLALAMAVHQPEYPIVVKPLVAIYWLFHFFYCVWIVCGLHLSVNSVHKWQWVIVLYFLTALFHLLAFGYVLLAVTSFTKKTEVLGKFWKRRVWWSLGIAVVSVGVSYLLPEIV